MGGFILTLTWNADTKLQLILSSSIPMNIYTRRWVVSKWSDWHKMGGVKIASHSVSYAIELRQYLNHQPIRQKGGRHERESYRALKRNAQILDGRCCSNESRDNRRRLGNQSRNIYGRLQRSKSSCKSSSKSRNVVGFYIWRNGMADISSQFRKTLFSSQLACNHLAPLENSDKYNTIHLTRRKEVVAA